MQELDGKFGFVLSQQIEDNGIGEVKQTQGDVALDSQNLKLPDTARFAKEGATKLARMLLPGKEQKRFLACASAAEGSELGALGKIFGAGPDVSQHFFLRSEKIEAVLTAGGLF